MTGSSLSAVSTVSIDQSIVETTLQVLQDYGALGLEGLVLWLGVLRGDEAAILRAFVPPQLPVSSEGGVGYFVDGETLFALNKALEETGLRLIAQVHSHPTDAYHSDTDDRYAIVTANGGLSLVVPDFGHAEPSPAAWAVYRLREGNWEELGPRQRSRLLQVT